MSLKCTPLPNEVTKWRVFSLRHLITVQRGQEHCVPLLCKTQKPCIPDKTLAALSSLCRDHINLACCPLPNWTLACTSKLSKHLTFKIMSWLSSSLLANQSLPLCSAPHVSHGLRTIVNQSESQHCPPQALLSHLKAAHLKGTTVGLTQVEGEWLSLSVPQHQVEVRLRFTFSPNQSDSA